MKPSSHYQFRQPGVLFLQEDSMNEPHLLGNSVELEGEIYFLLYLEEKGETEILLYFSPSSAHSRYIKPLHLSTIIANICFSLETTPPSGLTSTNDFRQYCGFFSS